MDGLPRQLTKEHKAHVKRAQKAMQISTYYIVIHVILQGKRALIALMEAAKYRSENVIPLTCRHLAQINENAVFKRGDQLF